MNKSPRRLGALLIVAVLSFTAVWVARPDAQAEGEPLPVNDGSVPPTLVADSESLAQNEPPPPIETREAVVRSGPATLLTPVDSDGESQVATEGLVLPILEATGERLRVLDSCNVERWVERSQVTVESVPVLRADTLDSAVFVIDAGHGGRDTGAVGPTGLTETELNLDIAARLGTLLSESRSIDPVSGDVTAGTDIPASGATILTRDPTGPNGGEYTAGLTYRATIANAADATAFISIHHNSSPETHLEHPGSEAFVRANDPDSTRLGGLIVEELRATLSRLGSDWEGSTSSGLVSRVNPDGSDYYTVLNAATGPAAIVEGSFISHSVEETLARTDEYRQEFAEAVYRALVRFVADEPSPIPMPEPTIWEADTGSVSMSGCEVP